DESLQGKVRVSVVATGTDALMVQALDPVEPHATRPPWQARRPADGQAQPQHAAVPAQAARTDPAAAAARAGAPCDDVQVEGGPPTGRLSRSRLPPRPRPRGPTMPPRRRRLAPS